jgi:hypothetical protein
MKTHIFANIGNRNLAIQNKNGGYDFIPSHSFRETTEDIWNNFGDYKDALRPMIIPAIIDKYPEGHLHLFVSNQDEAHESDTYFEGRILEKCFAASYPDLEVSIVTLRDAEGGIDPTNDEALIRFYRNWLKGNLNRLNDKVVFFDSGGTAQQKASLRAVLEFELPKHQLEQYYGKKEGDATVLNKLERNAAEKLFQKRQLRTLIEHYNYGAARVLLADINESNTSVELLLKLCDYLWNCMFHDIENRLHWNNFPKAVKRHPRANDIKHIVEKSCDNDDFEHSYYYNHAAWLFEKSQCALKTSDASTAIISLMQMLEVYCNGYISCHTPYNIAENYTKESEALLIEIIGSYKDVFYRQTNKHLKSFSVPVAAFYAHILLDESGERDCSQALSTLKNALTMFARSSFPEDMRLDTLRNNIAHRGKGVDLERFRQHYASVFAAAETLCGKHKGAFDNLNAVICELI